MQISPVSVLFLSIMSSRRLEDVFSIIIFRLPRRLQDLLQGSSRLFQDIFEDVKLSCWRRVEDVFKTCLEDNLKKSSRQTNVWWDIVCICLNNQHRPYPPWHCLPLKTEKLNERHISYPPWNNSPLWSLHSSVILGIPVIKLKTKKPLNQRHILYPSWNSRSSKVEKLNNRYIPLQSSFLKLVSHLWPYIWIFSNSSGIFSNSGGIFSNSSGNSVIVKRIINPRI